MSEPQKFYGPHRAQAPKPKPLKPSATQPRHASRFMEAAKVDDLNAGWNPVNYSADAVLRQELPRVRARSRYLAVNSPHFRRFLKLCEENVVGVDGIILRMRVTDAITRDGQIIMDKVGNRLIEEAWWKWNKRQYASYNHRDTFLAIQRLCITGVARDGEIFIRKIRGDSKNPFRFSLQLIEPDHVDVAYNQELGGGAYIRMGIEYDARDRVTAYHVYDRHPGDRIANAMQMTNRVRVPTSDMVHLFVRERPTQSRGIPWGVTSMARSKMLDGYTQAELVAARAAAGKMGFVVNPDGQSYTGDGEGVDENGNRVTISDFDPGTLEQLPEGWDFKAFDPQHPSTAFEPFVKMCLRDIFTGMGISYNKAANDYEGVNYSSLRESNLAERDFWKTIQCWFFEGLHEEIYRDWLEMALTTRQIPLPIAKIEKYDAATWRGRGWKWVDPLKEATAAEKNYSLGTTSLTRICDDNGDDFEQILQERKAEQELAKQYGVEISGGGTSQTSRRPGQ